MTVPHNTIWRPYTQMLTADPPIKVTRADGAILYTSDGRAIVDAIASWWVNIHGHNHPRLNRAIADQVQRFSQVIFAGFTHEPAESLAQELIRRVPAGLSHVFFSDNGSTAVEVALKMAAQYWRNLGEPQRIRFVCVERSYHGDTIGAMSVSGGSLFQQHFAPLLFPSIRVRGPAPWGDQTLPTIDEVLDEQGDTIAAVIVEPMVQGAEGMLFWPKTFLTHVRECTSNANVPLIADEVFTGFGRTGLMFACEHGPITPDIMCLSKGLTGGYLPLGATICTEDIFQAFLSEDRNKTLFHGHSFTGNALSCAVALESLRLFEDEDRLQRIRDIEGLFSERMNSLASNTRVANPRVMGGIAAFDVISSTQGYLAAVGPEMARAFLARNVLLRPLGNTVYVVPPYVITDEQVHRVFDTIEAVLGNID